MTQKCTIRVAELTFQERILFIRFFEGAELDLADVKEFFDLGLKFSGGKPYCILGDSRANPVSTPEARAFGAEQEYSWFRLADALLVNPTVTRLTANGYINFNKPKVPTRMFTSEEKAIAWLKTFL